MLGEVRTSSKWMGSTQATRAALGSAEKGMRSPQGDGSLTELVGRETNKGSRGNSRTGPVCKGGWRSFNHASRSVAEQGRPPVRVAGPTSAPAAAGGGPTAPPRRRLLLLHPFSSSSSTSAPSSGAAAAPPPPEEERTTFPTAGRGSERGFSHSFLQLCLGSGELFPLLASRIPPGVETGAEPSVLRRRLAESPQALGSSPAAPVRRAGWYRPAGGRRQRGRVSRGGRRAGRQRGW